MNKPLLSICIPTYNRAQYLSRCLDAIVGQDGFDERVEVVVSDNCSPDDTGDVVRAYREKYGNIRYFRNEENLADTNFSLSLQRATGLLRKLTNDTVIYQPGALLYMLEIARRYAEEKPQVYFLSSGKEKEDLLRVDTMEQYIDTVGINLTWIRALAVWDTDCGDLDLLITEAKSQMAQVAFLLDHFEKHGGAVICDRPVMGLIPMGRKDFSYGLFRVFHNNFLSFIRPYMERGEISRECYENLRKKLLFDFFAQWIYNLERQPERFTASGEDLNRLIADAYRAEPYYGEYRRMMLKRRLRAKAGRLLRRG